MTSYKVGNLYLALYDSFLLTIITSTYIYFPSIFHHITFFTHISTYNWRFCKCIKDCNQKTNNHGQQQDSAYILFLGLFVFCTFTSGFQFSVNFLHFQHSKSTMCSAVCTCVAVSEMYILCSHYYFEPKFNIGNR